MKKTRIIVSAVGVLLIAAIALTLASNKKVIDSRKETSVRQTQPSPQPQ